MQTAATATQNILDQTVDPICCFCLQVCNFGFSASEFQLCAAQNISSAYVLTSGQLTSAVLHTAFVQMKARNVLRLFEIQKFVAHGVTLQRHSPIKHYCKLQNKIYN